MEIHRVITKPGAFFHIKPKIFLTFLNLISRLFNQCFVSETWTLQIQRTVYRMRVVQRVMLSIKLMDRVLNNKNRPKVQHRRSDQDVKMELGWSYCLVMTGRAKGQRKSNQEVVTETCVVRKDKRKSLWMA